MVGAFDDEIVDPTGTAVGFGAAYEEFTSDDRLKLLEIWQDRALDVNNPKIIDASTETSGDILKTRVTNNGVITVTRQP